MNGVILVQYVRTLGKGHFGVTEEVSLRGRSACLKEPLRGTVDTDELRALMAIPPQRNTMQFIGIACRGRKLCLLCKLYGGGSVDKLHTTEDFLRDDRFLRALQDICRGVAHLHEHSIVHRDLACRNLLMDTDGTLVVGDYGLARKMEEEKQMYVRAYVGGAMTQFPLAWTAPEALRTKKFTKKSDMWSLGICLWEIATKGQEPYEKDLRRERWEVTERKIIEGKLKVKLPDDDSKV